MALPSPLDALFQAGRDSHAPEDPIDGEQGPPTTRWDLTGAFPAPPWKWEHGEGNATIPSSWALQINYSQGKELLNGSPPPSPLPMGNCRDSFSCPSGVMHVSLNP